MSSSIYESPLQELHKERYSASYSQVRTPAHTYGATIPRHYLTDTFEQTNTERDPYEEMTSYHRKTLHDNNWARTEEPLFEKDMPRRHAHYNAGLLQARYNGARGDVAQAEHGEMFLGDMTSANGKIDYRKGLNDEYTRGARIIKREMLVDSTDGTTPETIMQPWTMAAKKRELNEEMKQRLQFDDSRAAIMSSRGACDRDTMAGMLNTDVGRTDSLLIDAATFDKQGAVSNAPTSSLLLSAPDHRQPISVAQFSMLKSMIAARDDPQALLLIDQDARVAPGSNKEGMAIGSKHIDPKLTRDVITSLVTREGVQGVVAKPERDFKIVAHRGRELIEGKPLEMVAGSELRDRTLETRGIKQGAVDGSSSGLTALTQVELDAARKSELADAVDKSKRRGKLSGISAAEAAALVMTRSASRVGGAGVEDESVLRAVKNAVNRGVDPKMGKSRGIEQEESKVKAVREQQTVSYKSMPVIDKLGATLNKEHDMSFFESLATVFKKSKTADKGDLRDESIEETARTGNNKSVRGNGGGLKYRAGFDATSDRRGDRSISKIEPPQTGDLHKVTGGVKKRVKKPTTMRASERADSRFEQPFDGKA